MEQDGRVANHLDVVHGPAVQAGAIHGGVHFHYGSAERGTDPQPPPASWDDVPQLPTAVRFLLRAQVRAAQEMPYKLRGARRPSLATVHVRQELSSGTEETSAASHRPTPILDSRGQVAEVPPAPVSRVAVRPPTRTVREALDGDHHVLVTGGPGQGKSTLALRLAADIAARWSGDDDVPLTEPVVPCRLTARELAAQLHLPFSEALAHSARSEYGALLGAPLDAGVLGERVAGCRWLLLVDGLDEVADTADRDRLISVLAAWADPSSPYRVVVTTRPIDGTALAPLHRIGAARYELQPFDEEALARFAENWFADHDHAARFTRQLHAAHLDELVRIPLLATIAAIIFEQHGDRPLPDNQYELYEAYLKYLRKEHPTASPFDTVTDPLLEHLGRVRLEADTPLVDAVHAWHVPEHDPDELVAHLTAVGPLILRGGDLRFLHHSFAEHLAATAKARLLPTTFDPGHPDFAHLLHTARPKEGGRHARAVLLHYTRLHPDQADGLIEWLHQRNADEHLLAARLLASHVPASPHVVDAFLATARAWAMTTGSSAFEILSQASRTAHHPGTARWLAELVENTEVPWKSRVEAAAALATRLRGPDAGPALALLRSVVDDTAVPVQHRLSAAEALSECGRDERQASERGLRSVLADPHADGDALRTAAVVLAAFGDAARAAAVDALTAVLDDPWYPDSDLVKAATGLAEIGVEFHERCAEVFRSLLARRQQRHNAALGLASLGPQHLDDAATALVAVITDRRNDHSDRVMTADTLAGLGPQHRIVAAEHLTLIGTELGLTPNDHYLLAGVLVKLGLPGEAVRLTRHVLAERSAGPHDRLLAARELLTLGLDHREEAVGALNDVATDPTAIMLTRTMAWGALARAGQPDAVTSLRQVLADDGAIPFDRCRAASELARLGPEHHTEVARCLVPITSMHPDPRARFEAWRELSDLGTTFAAQAQEAMRVLSGNGEAAAWEATGRPMVVHRSYTDDPEAMAGAVTSVLRDPARSAESRLTACQSLVNLGRKYAPTAVEGAIAILRSGIISAAALNRSALGFQFAGREARARIAAAVREVALDPHASADGVCKAVEAMNSLGHRPDPEVISALRNIVADPLETAQWRGKAAITLARAVPDELPGALDLVIALEDSYPLWAWENQVHELVGLGADVVPVLPADAQQLGRVVTAALLAHLRPEQRADALAELWAQADDESLDFTWRTEAWLRLADIDPGARDAAIAFHRAVALDEREPVDDRVEAATHWASLDRSAAREVIALLDRLATSAGRTAGERGSALSSLASLNTSRSSDIARLWLTIARDPSASVEEARRAISALREPERQWLERTLLADRQASPQDRVGYVHEWDRPAFTAEVAEVLRDTLDAVESAPTRRVEAAAALARLGPRFVPEAARRLAELGTGRCAADEARSELADLGGTWRRQVVAQAERVLADPAESWRERLRAAKLIWRITPTPPEPVVRYTRELVHGDQIGLRHRVRGLYLLRQHDGLDAVRAYRDREGMRPAIRWTAANLLRDHTAADRSTGVRVLDAIATDRACRPALRWRAARDLLYFGARGRAAGAEALRAIATDTSMTVLVRRDAARALGQGRPDLRFEMTRLLSGLVKAAAPLARVQVWSAIGSFEPYRGAVGLRAMALDRTLSPATRVRAADAMIECDRGSRETASMVVREVANDPGVPRHVRVKAARALAHWSDICRAEAQRLLVSLSQQAG